MDKVDHERVNPFAIKVSFPAIKERVDQSNTSDIQGIKDMVGLYQLDGDDAYTLEEIDNLLGFKHLFKHTIGQNLKFYL